MANTEQLQEIATQFSPDQKVAVGKWFGKPCLATDKRVFVVLWGSDLAFKLAGEAHSEALQIKGAHLFDPRGKGAAMKEWVQIPKSQSSLWGQFARRAYDYVTSSKE
jgi:hypothetical protein